MKHKLFLALALVLITARFARAGQPLQFAHPGAQQMWMSADGNVVISQAVFARERRRNLTEIKVWDVSGAQPSCTEMPVPENFNISAQAVSDDGKRLAVYTDAGIEGAKWWRQTVELWRIENGRATRTGVWNKPEGRFTDVRWQGQSVQILQSRSIAILDSRARLVQSIPLDWQNKVFDRADGVFSPDGKWVALCNYDDQTDLRTAIFEARTGRLMRRFDSLPPTRFAPDNRTLLTYGDLRMFEPYDPNNGPFYTRQLRDVWSDNPPFSPPLWSGRSAELLYPKMHVLGEIYSALPFSPDGTAMMDYQGVFYELNSKTKSAFQIPRPFRDDRWLNTVRLSQDGHTIAALDAQGNLWVERTD